MIESIDFLVEPKEEYLALTKPTIEFLQIILSVIKNCQVENIPCDEYIKTAHNILKTFINQPLVK